MGKDYFDQLIKNITYLGSSFNLAKSTKLNCIDHFIVDNIFPSNFNK